MLLGTKYGQKIHKLLHYHYTKL